MSLRPLRYAAALLFASLAFGVAPTAPALADGIVAKPARLVATLERVRTVRRAAPRIVYVPVYYAASCGGCGSAVAYAPPPPRYHYSGSCGGCGHGVAKMRHSYSDYVGSYRTHLSHSYRQRFSNHHYFHRRHAVPVRY